MYPIMCKFLLIVSLLFSPFLLLSQDLVVTQDGSSYNAYNLDIGSNAIFFTLQQDDNQIKKVPVENVLIIRFADGTTRVFADKSKDTGENKNQGVKDIQYEIARPDISANALLLEKYRTASRVIPQRARNMKADAGILLFVPTNESILCNSDLEVIYESGHYDPAISGKKYGSSDLCHTYIEASINLSVKNKTDKTIYLDLSNSFVLINATAYPYYIPTATSISHGTNGGASVNLGGVTNALGIGGVVGAIASSVNVGGGSSDTNTTVTYSQRIVAIPPKSAIKLREQPIFPNEKYDHWGDLVKKSTAWGLVFNKQYCTATVESELKFDEYNTPAKWGTYITYGFNEQMTDTASVEASFYLKSIFGHRQYFPYEKYPQYFAGMKDAFVMIFNNFLH